MIYSRFSMHKQPVQPLTYWSSSLPVKNVTSPFSFLVLIIKSKGLKEDSTWLLLEVEQEQRHFEPGNKKENYDNILEAKFSLREEITKAIKKGVSLVNK